MTLSKGAKHADGPFEGNGLEICRDLQGLMRRLELERGIVSEVPRENEPAEGKGAGHES